MAGTGQAEIEAHFGGEMMGLAWDGIARWRKQRERERESVSSGLAGTCGLHLSVELRQMMKIFTKKQLPA